MTDKTKIKVIGVGSAGTNTINRMIKNGLTGVEFLVMNTDIQLLEASDCENKLQLGKKTTKGLGSGGDPQIGEKAAKETEQDIKEALKGADMVFIVAGFGGGTGTGATPVIAKIAKDMGILTIAVVTRPFSYEGRERKTKADTGIKELRKSADAVADISNDILLTAVDRQVSMAEAYSFVDDIIFRYIQSISDTIIKPGIICTKFDDLKKVLQNAGSISLVEGKAKGENPAVVAANAAINSQSGNSLKNAQNVIIHLKCSPNTTIHEIYDAACVLREVINDDAGIIITSNVDENLQDEMNITIITTENKED